MATLQATSRPLLGWIVILLLRASVVAGQSPGSIFTPIVEIGSEEHERLRNAELSGTGEVAGRILYSTSALSPEPTPRGDTPFAWGIVAPRVRYVWNSELPSSLNDGALWAGRGSSYQVLAGVTGRVGPLFATFAPQFSRTANADFQIFTSTQPDRSAYANPWREGPYSADIPFRFGDAPYTQFDFGQSRVGIAAGPVEAGITTEDEWWGPATRNAIVLSNNAAGVPRLFIRTARPVSTPIGDVDARWLNGVLTESLYFDQVKANDHRSFTGLAATLQPAPVPGLTIGFARGIVGEIDGPDGVWGQSLRPFHWDPGLDREQAVSIIARWVFPADGIEIYGEWADHSLPESLSDLIDRPQQSLGYTLGTQWLKPLGADSASHFRLQAEVNMLERRNPRVPQDERNFGYTSEEIPQGYTHRGQVLGAAIGPGGSAQWLGLDYFGREARIGLGLGRVRWDTDVFFNQPRGWSFLAHDVSVLGEVRGSGRLGPFRVSGVLGYESRLNYLFQNYYSDWNTGTAVDVRNVSLRLNILAIP